MDGAKVKQRANAWVIVLALLVAAGGLYALLQAPAPAPDEGGVARERPVELPTGVERREGPLREAPAGAATGPAERADTQIEASLPLPDGRPVGTIRGTVAPPRGQKLPPDAWVIVQPSATLIGSDFARRSELPVDAEGRFEFVGLPLAGYDVQAHFAAGASEQRPVLLRAGRESVFIELTLQVRATLRGRVVDSNGLAVPEIEVSLAPATASRFTPEPFARTRSDDAGLFRFEYVPDGDWQVLVGPLTAPATDPLAVAVQGGDLSLPSIEVPALATLALTVTDEYGGILPGIDINGFGDAGGLIRGQSDAFGRLDATLLPPGRYRLRANDAEYGMGQLTLEIRKGAQRVEGTLVLRR
ncbi:MAG: carboxypeptidase-like regulatory domain-containing protein [Planctomycetota bacterium]